MRTLLRVSLAALLAALPAMPGAAQSAAARPQAAAAPPPAASEPPSPSTPRQVQLQGPARQVFERLGQLYGVRLRIDEQVAQRPIDIRMDGADFITALRVATQLTNSFWVPRPDGSIVIAPDTKEARDLYDKPIERSYALPGATPEELAEVVRLLREILDMRDVRPDLRSNTITIQDTATRLAAAERLLGLWQEDTGEVWLEALVLNINRDKAQQYGILPPDQVIAVHAGAGALALSGSSTVQDLINNLRFLFQQGVLPSALVDIITASLASGGTLTIPSFILVGAGATTYALFLPNATLHLSQLASVTRSWRQLNLRAREGQEATIFIGDRTPIVTGAYTSAFAIPSALLTLPPPAMQYEDLGLKLTVTPRLHSKTEMTLALKFEDKQLSGRNANGVAIISNRTLEQQVRLKEGESLVLAGIQSHTTEYTITGTPGLSALPVLGHLFKRTAPRNQDTELVLLLTPHVVRLPARERIAMRTLPIGTDRKSVV